MLDLLVDWTSPLSSVMIGVPMIARDRVVAILPGVAWVLES